MIRKRTSWKMNPRGAAPRYEKDPNKIYAYNSTPTVYKYSHLGYLRQRRTDEELRAILDERLAKCRARPNWDAEVDALWVRAGFKLDNPTE